MKTLFLLCGAPGSGKTTFAKEKLIPHLNSVTYVSRDDIRYSFLNETDDYFAHEDEVFNEYIKDIQEGIKNSDNIICDATHLTERARNSVLDRLDLSNIDIIHIFYFLSSLNVCLERNERRTDRAKIKRGIVRRMYFSIEIPSQEEKYGNLYRIEFILSL